MGLSLSDDVDRLTFAGGNAGTAQIGENLPFGPGDLDAIADYVQEVKPPLTVVGPEQPLVDGLVDRLDGYPVLGSSAAAARLEGDKAFAVGFMQRHHIPCPDSLIVDRPDDVYFGPDAQSYVLKASGLAGGKGVILPETHEEAVQALHGMLSGELFGEAGERVVVQQRLHGPEVSLFAVSDGKDYVILPPAQDHKRLYDGDQGPNTGGMGAYAPVPADFLSGDQWQKAYDIVDRTIAGARADDMPYKGILYVGLMFAEECGGDPVVIEYNCRFGDPEAQVVLPTLDTSVHGIFESAAHGHLDRSVAGKQLGAKAAALTICLAAPGYPASPQKGSRIHGLERTYDDVTIQHGSTKLGSDNSIVTAGGRVLYVTGMGKNLQTASQRAQAAIGGDAIHFDGMQHRTDIGRQVF
jgi:phosphoribosylamine--glycine ligase